ncbi:hypothetical protein B0H34DRAFT_720333 [Crassisporium funariophilum]|nr:hypothetical protein B0H34DRAFT_720333 [Crassisporium funariophilum]
MFGQPYYRSYNPYIPASYQRSSPFDATPYRNARDLAEERALQQRAQALAEQRARRAQYLPDEDEGSEEEWEYNQLGPRGQAYVDARRKQDILERMQREEALAKQRAAEEQHWHEALERRQREAAEDKQRLLEQRRRQMQEKRDELARRLVAEEHERKSRLPFQQRQQDGPRASSQPRQDQSVPINVRRSTSQQPHSNAPPVSRSPSQSVPVQNAGSPGRSSEPAVEPFKPTTTYTEEHENAASKIQTQYRLHKSLRALDDIASQFETSKKNFAYPSVIDFQKPGSENGVVSVRACRPPSDFDNDDDWEMMDADAPEAKLAYTSVNFPLHAYTDGMDKLLMKLDGVDSGGKKSIRMRRRAIIKDIEKEGTKLERYWKQAWREHVEQERKTNSP